MYSNALSNVSRKGIIIQSSDYYNRWWKQAVSHRFGSRQFPRLNVNPTLKYTQERDLEENSNQAGTAAIINGLNIIKSSSWTLDSGLLIDTYHKSDGDGTRYNWFSRL